MLFDHFRYLHFSLRWIIRHERENNGLILTCSASRDKLATSSDQIVASSTDSRMLFVLLFGIQLVTSSDQAVATSTDSV